jgi:hypothetical protein
LYEAWITNKELQNAIIFPYLLAVDIKGGGIIIGDHMMMIIVARLDNTRRNFPSL